MNQQSHLAETASIAKDFAKHLILEGRESLSNGFYRISDAVDTDAAQKAFVRGFHARMEARRITKEREAAIKTAKVANVPA